MGKVLLLLFIAFIIFALIDAARERKANPEKWAAKDAERAAAEKRKADAEYQEAMQRVPPSEWMRMNRHEKADVLERREKAAKRRSERS